MAMSNILVLYHKYNESQAAWHSTILWYNTDMNKKVILTLVGLDGNAYSLMGAFSKAARRQGWSPAEIKVVMDECMSGDYDNLLRTLMDNTVEEDDENED